MQLSLQQHLMTHDYWSGKVESESDDLDNCNLGHLGHFLEGQVGLIRKLNYLDVTRISHACSLENSVGIWYISE